MAGIEDCYTASRGNTKTQVGRQCQGAIILSYYCMWMSCILEARQWQGRVPSLL